MNIPASSALETPVPAETNLQKEQRIFGELFRRLVNAVINSIFDLRPLRAVQRMQYLIFLFLLSILLISLTHEDYTLPIWADHLRNMFSYVFTQDFAARYPGNAINDFFRFVYDAFTDPRTLQYLPVFLAPFFIALQSAAIYL